MQTKSENIRKYEIMTLSKGSLGEESAKKLSSEVADLIVSLGGKLLENDFWGKRRLAYNIRNEKDGFYDVKKFEIDPSKKEALITKLNLVANLVRYLITAKS